MIGIDEEAIKPDGLAQVTGPAAASHRDRRASHSTQDAEFVARCSLLDLPARASPSVAVFVCTLNDGLPQAERASLIVPFVPRLAGTRGSEALERRRIGLVTDWLVRVHVPAWFRLAKLNVEADELADLPALRDPADLASFCDHMKRARKRAAIANLTLRQTGPAVRAAAWDAIHLAAWVSVRDALAVAGPPILAAGWDAAYAAAYAAARAYGKAPLEPTRRALQDAALALVEDLIAMRDPASSGAALSS